jgi:hypothetical protein
VRRPAGTRRIATRLAPTDQRRAPLVGHIPPDSRARQIAGADGGRIEARSSSRVDSCVVLLTPKDGPSRLGSGASVVPNRYRTVTRLSRCSQVSARYSVPRPGKTGTALGGIDRIPASGSQEVEI